MTSLNAHRGGEDLAWHYTSLSTLQSVLKNKELWAGEVEFQNDPSENDTARSVLEQAAESVKDDPLLGGFARNAITMIEHMFGSAQWTWNADKLLRAARFVLCCSLDGDNLYAWRTYASKDAIGCAIGIDRSVQWTVKNGTGTVSRWLPVFYDQDALRAQTVKTLRRLREAARNDTATEVIEDLDVLWSELLMRAKHPSYRDEKELRLMVLDGVTRNSVDFMTGHSGPRPFVRLGVASKDALLPISEIRLAPDAPEGASNSVAWLLAINGYPIDGELEWDAEQHRGPWLVEGSAVTVTRSVHPYRLA